LRDRIRLDSITCVVDQIRSSPTPNTLEHLKLRQIAFADITILNKADLAGPEQVKKVRASIDGHLNRLRIVETSYCNVPLEILLSVGHFDPTRTDLDRRVLEHANCRAKGIAYASNAPEHRVVLQVVGKRVDITLSHEWGERQPCTQLIAIGEHGATNDEALRRTFDRCLADLQLKS
jgi:G3E family GTPase